MASLENKCFSLPWSEKQCLAAFSQKAYAAFGLFQSENLIAYISFYHTYDELEILNIAVIPEQRGKGYGKRLLKLSLQIAIRMGIKKAILEVRESNLVALNLYKKCAFLQSGKRKKYYPDTGEDALILECSF